MIEYSCFLLIFLTLFGYEPDVLKPADEPVFQPEQTSQTPKSKVIVIDDYLETKWGDWKQLDVLQDGWDQTDTGSIVKVDGTYHIFYGVHDDGAGWNGEWRICHSASSNGIDWVDPTPILDYSDEVDNTENTGCGDPSVLYFDGQFHMWYVYKLLGGYDKSEPVADQQWCIGYATSKDAANWVVKTDELQFDSTLSNPYFKAAHCLEPRIVYINDDVRWMYYIKRFGRSGTYRSVSLDKGLTWGPEERGEGMEGMARCWHVFWHRRQFHALFSKANEHPGPIYIADSMDGLNWHNHRVFVDNENFSDANTVYPVNTEKDFPHGLGAHNTLESANWRLLVKTLVQPNHRMGLARNLAENFDLAPPPINEE